MIRPDSAADAYSVARRTAEKGRWLESGRPESKRSGAEGTRAPHDRCM